MKKLFFCAVRLSFKKLICVKFNSIKFKKILLSASNIKAESLIFKAVVMDLG